MCSHCIALIFALPHIVIALLQYTHLCTLLQLEMILQAQEYEAEQNIDLQDFFDSTKGRFTTPVGQAWAKEIVKRRADRQSLGHGKGSS